MADSGDLQLFRYPQSKSVDAVRWLHPVSAFDRFIATAVHDTDDASSAVEIHSLSFSPESRNPNKPLLHLRSNWPSPSRISALRTSETHQKHVVAAVSTFAGSVHFLFVDPVDVSIDLELSTDECHQPLHNGPVSAVDLQSGGHECVSVGEDGRVNLVSVGEGGLIAGIQRELRENNGISAYDEICEALAVEEASGGGGVGGPWAGRRRPGGAGEQLKACMYCSGRVDSHKPNLYDTFVVGGSSGTVFAWDLRWQQQPILLSGVSLSGTGRSTCESEIWEIQYDIHAQTSSISSTSSTKILPVMACSEDGILAVIEQGKPHTELLAEDCAINSFNIDPQNPADVVCALEWESIGILMRAKEAASPVY
ncbi:hypothetical protein KSP40_PGU015273 [Platanthera guangdongensis]|uniref:Nuclear pore complex protein NUP43 n=1 Tax=Platanthera guangdongensis TaxID=2320717 RepID=A0ABR2MEN2_9ASPA